MCEQGHQKCTRSVHMCADVSLCAHVLLGSEPLSPHRSCFQRKEKGEKSTTSLITHLELQSTLTQTDIGRKLLHIQLQN